jgi:hypothetical protein
VATLDDFLKKANPLHVATANMYADSYGIPREIFQSLVSVESGWNVDAANPGSSAYGLTQLTNAAAIDAHNTDKYTYEGNLKGGADYLSQKYKQTGNWNDALAAYNQGYGNYKNAAGQAYAEKVMTLANTANKNAGIGGGSTATGMNGNQIERTLYDPMGNVIGVGYEPAETDTSKTESKGVLGFVKDQMGNVSFMVLGVVIIAVALVMTGKNTVTEVVVDAAKAAL